MRYRTYNVGRVRPVPLGFATLLADVAGVPAGTDVRLASHSDLGWVVETLSDDLRFDHPGALTRSRRAIVALDKLAVRRA